MKKTLITFSILFFVIFASMADAATVVNSSQNLKLTAGLVGLWSFDGKDLSGTTAYDRSGQGNNATMYASPTKVVGKIGQALQFNGSTSYASVSSTAKLATGANGSWCMWVYEKSLGTQGFLETASYRPLIYNSVGANNLAVYWAGATGLPIANEYIGDIAFSLNKWNHLCITWSNSNAINVYMNGVSVAGYTGVTLPVAATNGLSIGQYFWNIFPQWSHGRCEVLQPRSISV